MSSNAQISEREPTSQEKLSTPENDTQSPKYSITVTEWCVGVSKQIDDSFSESTHKITDILAHLAKEEKIITENKNEEQVRGFPDLSKSIKGINDHAKFLAAWGLLFTRTSMNPYAHRHYHLFLTHLEQSCLHLDQAISKVCQNPMFVEPNASTTSNPPNSDSSAVSSSSSSSSSSPILLSTSNMKKQ